MALKAFIGTIADLARRMTIINSTMYDVLEKRVSEDEDIHNYAIVELKKPWQIRSYVSGFVKRIEENPSEFYHPRLKHLSAESLAKAYLNFYFEANGHKNYLSWNKTLELYKVKVD